MRAYLVILLEVAMLLLIENIPKNLLKMRIMLKSNQLGMWSMKFDYPWDFRKNN